MLTPRNWTHLVISEAGGRPLAPVQLQKALFLVGDKLNLPGPSRYNFKPYDYGPFCATVYSDADELEREGLVNIDQGGSYRRYCATAAGIEKAKPLLATLDVRSRQYLSNVVGYVRELSFKELVEAIYESYPDMKANSIYRS